ncbi:PH-domain-containing protein [Dentipellis sp. KUC8613]|nr:PH-domain-containing protein [Dentipellis sp. KUC8613]
MSSQPVAPPTPQEVSRKLSIHSTPKPKIHPHPHSHSHRPISPTDASRPPQVSPGIVSGNESDSDSVFAPDYGSPAGPAGAAGAAHTPVSAGAPLSAIAERRRSGEDSEEDDDDDHDDVLGGGAGAVARKADVSDIKAGYLWKKGERRKTWKKRWFVLRPTHLAYYKTSAEYQLHRLLDLNDVHSCTPVSLKKHENTLGVVSATRTFYLQAQSQEDMQGWVRAIREAKETLQATSTQNSAASTAAIPIPVPRRSGSHPPPPVTPSPPHHLHAITSSESEDASPHTQRMYATSSSPQSFPLSSSPRQMSGVSPAAAAAAAAGGAPKDGSKPVASGYLMKCGSKRRNWRKRWFVLNGDKLMYSGSHMDTKPHRQIPLSQILDAFEYDLPAHRGAPNVTSPPAVSPPPRMGGGGAGDEADPSQHTFKIVTTKRTLLLCAPSEEEEIRWLSAVRALIARRTDAGVVPGDEGGRGGAAVGTEGGGHGQGGVGSGSGSGSGLKNRREAPPRKMSTSGGSIYAAPIAEESVS